MTDNNSISYAVVAFVCGLIIVIVAFLTTIRFSRIGEGTYRGYVTTIEQQGYIFKNYSVWFKSDRSSSNEDTFCIREYNSKLAKLAEEANMKKKEITLKLRGVRGIGFGQCGDTEIVDIIQ